VLAKLAGHLDQLFGPSRAPTLQKAPNGTSKRPCVSLKQHLAFNADAGTVRIVALVSPACGACLRGATDIQAVFGDIGGTRLRGYIVWVPKLDGQENNVPEATHTVADPRAGHYWDANGYLVHAYDRTLHLGQDAWDIYLLYGPGTRWDSADPPTPAYWMNQLGGANGPTLDSQTFTDHARALLRQPAR
jgi:hypothetical protein